MADINVDVNLPGTITVDVTSPTQAFATNVSIPGPQGPAGPRGAGNNTNGLTPDFLYITGRDGIIVSSNGVDTIFISGNSGYFQSAVDTLTTNLNNTGTTLNSTINSLSGTLTSNYATTINLASTGSNLQTQINNLDNVYATDVDVTNLNNKITSLSGDAVLEYGNQTIQGQKTFTEDLIVQKSGFFWSGIKIGLNSIIINEESIKIAGDPVVVQSTFTGYTGYVSNTYATINNLNLLFINIEPRTNVNIISIFGLCSCDSSTITISYIFFNE
jgi:hypothetical protein